MEEENIVLFQNEDAVSISAYMLSSVNKAELLGINSENMSTVPAICSTKYIAIPATMEKPILFWLNNCPIEMLANTINK